MVCRHRLSELVLVEAPLRMHLTAPGEGAVLVSDRALKIESAVAAVPRDADRPGGLCGAAAAAAGQHEPSADYPWLSEGLSRIMAARFIAQAYPDTRSVQDWIELFNIFAIVDRFEIAPKIPFVGTFFERAPQADELHEQITTFNNDLPSGHVILGKLRQLVGDAAFDRVSRSLPGCIRAVSPVRGAGERPRSRRVLRAMAAALSRHQLQSVGVCG